MRAKKIVERNCVRIVYYVLRMLYAAKVGRGAISGTLFTQNSYPMVKASIAVLTVLGWECDIYTQSGLRRALSLDFGELSDLC